MQRSTKIAVAGATGRAGRQVVDILESRGYDVVPISRSQGVDVITGEGLDQALTGVDTIIDVATGPSPDQQAATEFFTTSTRNLQEAGERAGALSQGAAGSHRLLVRHPVAPRASRTVGFGSHGPQPRRRPVNGPGVGRHRDGAARRRRRTLHESGDPGGPWRCARRYGRRTRERGRARGGRDPRRAGAVVERGRALSELAYSLLATEGPSSAIPVMEEGLDVCPGRRVVRRRQPPGEHR